MIHDPDSKILNIVKLRASIKSTSKEGRIGALYDRFDEILVHMLEEAVKELPDNTLASLVCESEGFAPLELLTAYNSIQSEEKLREILTLRDEAILNGNLLDISSIVSGFTNIPVTTFDWNHKATEFLSLMAKIKSADCGYAELAGLCTVFFENHGVISMPAGYPKVSGNLVRNLMKQGLISRENTEPVIDCINHIKNRVNSTTQKKKNDFFNGGISAEQFSMLKDDAYMLLKEIRSSEFSKAPVGLDKYIVYWNGPGKVTFLDVWWRYDPSEKNGLIIAACTGIHPKTDAESWKLWIRNETSIDRNGAESFLSLVEGNRFYYELGFILSCRENLDGFLDEIWQPLFNTLQEKIFQERKESLSVVSASKTEIPKDIIKKPGEALAIDFDVEEGGALSPVTHEMVMDGAEADLNIEELSVDEKPKSHDDRIIEERSTWHRYLKPFLSENLIGVLGAGFLMLAWFTISVWVWNKGQYFRILAGALPMFATSLGLGWISRFFYKNLDRGVSPKAPLLFASLCILTLPFNYLISLSMLLSGSLVGISAGVVMAIVYTAALFLISNWTKDIFTFRPGPHLVEINTYILLPALGTIFIHGVHPLSVDIILFLTSFAFARMLYFQRDVDELSSRVKFCLFGGNCLLIIFIFCVYVRLIPSTASFALFMQFSAMVIAFFAKPGKRINAIILSSCLSLAGILVAVSASYMLLICLVLSALLWAYQRKDIDASWPDEIVASLILLLVPAGIYVSGSNWLLAGFFFIPVVFAACLYEQRTASGEIKVISFTLPVYILLLAMYFLMPSSVTALDSIAGLAAVLIYGIYGYRRYEGLYHKRLWFFNSFLMIVFPFICAVTRVSLELSVAILGISVLLWSVVSLKLKGPLACQYRISVQWIMSFVVSGLFLVSSGMNAGFNLSSTVGYLVIAASLLIGARKSSSQLPVYVVIVCSGVFVLSLLQFLEISFKTGTGSALSSVLLLFSVYLLERFSVWQNLRVNDRFFEKIFPLKTDKFLIYPIEITAWILATLGFGKAMVNYTFIYGSAGFSFSGVKVCLTFLIVSFVCVRFVNRYALKKSGYLILIPAIALYVNICSLLPLALLPVFIVLSMFLLSAFVKHLGSSEETDPEIIKTLENFMLVLSYAIIPAGFLMYVYYYLLPGNIADYQFEIVLSAVLVSVFIHMTSVRKINVKLVHFILGHVTLLVSLGYLVLEKEYLQYLVNVVVHQTGFSFPFASSSLHFVLILSAVYLFSGFMLETGKGRIKKAYSEAFHIWLLIAAVLYSILISSVLCIGSRGFPVYYFIVGIFLVHAGNRYFFSFSLVFLKAFFCLITGVMMFQQPLAGIVAGLVIFSIIEYVVLFLEKVPQLRLQSVAPHGESPLWRAAWVIHGFTIIFLLVHMALFVLAPADVPHYLMYALIPFGVFVFRNLGYRYTGYMAVGIFAYTNGFVALQLFSSFFHIHGLNTLHLLSIAMTLSLLLYRGFDISTKRMERTA